MENEFDRAASAMKYGRESEAAQVNLVAILKPKLTIDGDKYCFLLGDNLIDGVAGFGESPHAAACDFSDNWHKSLTQPPVKAG